MLIDRRRWTKSSVGELAHEYARGHGEQLVCWDQDALNWAVDGRWSPLDRRWNAIPVDVLMATSPFEYFGEPAISWANLVEVARDPFIAHFAGPCKPWNESYPDTLLAQEYRSVARSVSVRF